MKVNKITFFICFTITIISGLGILAFANNDILQNICLGLFTGFIASAVIAVINYFHERAKIIEKMKMTVLTLHLNLSVISKTLGKVLPTIHTVADISDIDFHYVSHLSEDSVNSLKQINFGLYSPIYTKSNKAIAGKELNEFYTDAATIKTCAYNLEKNVIEYNTQYLRLYNQAISSNITPTEQLNLDTLKNLVNIRTAKLQEYTATKVVELEKIAKKFYGSKKEKMYWENIKIRLEQKANSIVEMM